MYSRFLTWQQRPGTSLATEVADVNSFRIDDESVDIRFKLRGYGFKRAGERNRIIYHFGTYRCFFRRAGAPDFTLFANAVSERADQEDADVYRDIGVTSGLIPRGVYDIRVEAGRLLELETWAGGVMEGIASGSGFVFDLEARQGRRIATRPIERVSTREFIAIGFDPTDLSVADELQAQDTITTDVGIGIDASDAIAALETVTIGPPG